MLESFRLHSRMDHNLVPRAQEAASSLMRDVDEDDSAAFEAEGLLEGNPIQGMTAAQRSLLQALEVQVQVQQYAEMALAAARMQERAQQRQQQLTTHSAAINGGGSEDALERPANLAALLRGHSSATRPASFLRVRATGQEKSFSSSTKKTGDGSGEKEMVKVFLACHKNSVSQGSHSGHSGGMTSEDVAGEARRAAGIVRASSIRHQANN